MSSPARSMASAACCSRGSSPIVRVARSGARMNSSRNSRSEYKRARKASNCRELIRICLVLGGGATAPTSSKRQPGTLHLAQQVTELRIVTIALENDGQGLRAALAQGGEHGKHRLRNVVDMIVQESAGGEPVLTRIESDPASPADVNHAHTVQGKFQQVVGGVMAEVHGVGVQVVQVQQSRAVGVRQN